MADVQEEEMTQELESVKTVFRQDLLREMILDMAIHQPNSSIGRKTLISLRQVQKSWHDTISNRLRHLKEPLFIVKLDQSNSVSGSPHVEAHGKALDLFTSFYFGRDETVKLKLREDFFRLENYDSFSIFLKTFSESLVELELLVPWKAGSFPGLLPNVGLPNLQKLSTFFTRRTLPNLEQNENTLWGHPSNTTMLLETVLRQSANLKELVILIDRHDEALAFPPGFQYFTLPASLKEIYLNGCLEATDLEVLTRNNLPVLTNLHIDVTGLPLPGNVLLNVIDSVKTTLVYLRVQGKGDSQSHLIENHVGFPEMQKLETLTFAEFNAVLDEDTKQNLDTRFPKLKALALGFQTLIALDSWVCSKTLATVKELSLLPVGSELGILSSPETMRKFCQAMPNMTQLEIWPGTNHAKNLEFLFVELSQVTNLKIIVSKHDGNTNNWDVWDSLLTGLPQEIISALRLNPDFENNFEIVLKESKNSPSIRLLKNLTELSLIDKNEWNIQRSMLSYLSFKFAFLKMPKLEVLKLRGNFMVCPNMVAVWKKSGRHIFNGKTESEFEFSNF